MARFVEVEIAPNPAEVARGFWRAGAQMRNLRAPLEQSVRRVAIPSIQENFFEGGRPKWDQLSDETIARREEEGSGERPLIRSGAGMDAATSRARWHITSRQAEYPSNWPPTREYMKFQHEGTSNMPARPFGVLQDPQDIAAIEAEFARWVDHAVIARALGYGLGF